MAKKLEEVKSELVDNVVEVATEPIQGPTQKVELEKVDTKSPGHVTRAFRG